MTSSNVAAFPVLHLISGRGPTGAAAAAINDLQALRAAGIRACAGCRKDAPAVVEALLQAGVPSEDIFSQFKFARGAMSMITGLRDASYLAKILREQNIQHVHVHRAGEQWLAYLASYGTTPPALIRTWHRDPRGEALPVLNTLAGHTTGCVCVAREHESPLLAAGAPRTRFVHGAVDTDFFEPRGERCAGNVPRIGQAGRWKREHGRDRGQQFTLEVFAALSTDLRWHGELLGRGEFEEDLRRRAYKELKLAPNRVSLTSTQGKTGSEFAAMLNALDLGLVLAVGSDGTSRPALEMLSSGVPLIVADVPGLRELAEDPSCAVVGPRHDVKAWARAIETLVADLPRLRQMQIAARERALAVHALRVRGESLAAFYRECR
jgi:glycosyltransferase involved in cell wall biosynthesis